MIKTFLLIALLTLQAAAQKTWIFQSTSGPVPAVGVLQVNLDPAGHGFLWLGGEAFRLVGPGLFFRGWWTDHLEWSCCLVIDPEDPWISGVMFWKDGKGILDLFSTDGVLGEWQLDVSRREDLP